MTRSKIPLTVLLTPQQYADWQAYCLEHGVDACLKVVEMIETETGR